MKAFDMSRHQRLIGTEGRISGLFAVLGGTNSGTIWIKPHEVTIYDEGRRFGTIFGSKDFSASVKDGVPEYRVYNDRLKHDVDDVHDMLLAALLLVAQAFTEGVGAVVDEDGSVVIQ